MVVDPLEDYQEFIKAGQPPEVLNRAAALSHKYGFTQDSRETIAKEIERRGEYNDDKDVDYIQDTLKHTAVKAAVYSDMSGEFGDPERLASLVHSKSVEGKENIRDMQLREQYDASPSASRMHWTSTYDLELADGGDRIAGRGYVPHAILRFADSREDMSREEAAEAINEVHDRQKIDRTSLKQNREMEVADELDSAEEYVEFIDRDAPI
jgi:hypothetical protein